ncbi:hypothetical protein ACH6EH_07155 [Paenibacillus sp. JSM ZJ436]|uniref:hypothetical protein n=1 Tax=Paenibacillus sp. JSM ZJ436 TaxID=3376190 RepID=UPI0037ACFA64
MKEQFYNLEVDSMSWEVMSDREYPCPCKKGTYREISENDDWNNWREEVIMNCPSCKEKYVQHFFTKPDGEERWYWKEK